MNKKTSTFDCFITYYFDFNPDFLLKQKSVIMYNLKT